MFSLDGIRRKMAGLAVVTAATCFSHGSCNSGGDFLYETFDVVEEFFYDYYYYDDYGYYDDCRCDTGGGFWFDWF